jgi:toxin-antitoxin system PIN domain toxin
MRTSKPGDRKIGLLDINVLIALIDPEHEFHEQAHAWFQWSGRHGWATCPITENGCLRIMSEPSYPFPGLTVERVRGILGELVRVPGHEFWPDSLSVLDAAGFSLAGTTPKQLTDLYLLGLAVRNSGRLVTLDGRIPWQSVAGCAPENLEVLGGDAAG